MKVYFDGRYFSADCGPEDREYLLTHCPQKFYSVFTSVKPTEIIDKSNHIYQTWFDDKSKSDLDGGFIPYKTGLNHNFENDIILDIWRSRSWINAKLVGVLSWRFYQKTGLTSDKLRFKKPVTCYFPKGYEKYKHPYSRNGFLSVTLMVECADRYNLFPFKLKDFKIKKLVWCNYWIATPAIFDDYCTRYLSKAIEFFKGRPEYNLTEHHRGQQIPAMTFFLEGLFSVYLTREQIDYESI